MIRLFSFTVWLKAICSVSSESYLVLKSIPIAEREFHVYIFMKFRVVSHIPKFGDASKSPAGNVVVSH
jgi:hypothetical protein